MSGRNLLELEVVAQSKTALLEEGLATPKLTPEQRGRGYTALSDWHRTAAVCRLLAHADGDGFRRGLRTAGEARRELLGLRARQAWPFDCYTGSARYLPLCCAIAAGADDLAKEIIQLSAEAPVPREEVEEDALFALALGAMVRGESPTAELAALEALVGEEIPRCALLRAIVSGDRDGLGPAVDSLATAWAEDLDSIPRMNRTETFQADRGVFIEGLALLRLAGSRGLPLAAEYPWMPSLARVK